MPNESKLTKKQLLKMIDELSNNPNDKGRILGDLGITTIGAGLSWAASGSIAAATGVTTIPAVTSVASWFGMIAVAPTPLGLAIGVTVLGGALTYGVSRLIRDGGLSEGRKAELLQKFKEDLKKVEAKERSSSITDKDRSSFIISLRELIDKNAITPDKAVKLISQVEQGLLPLSQAFELIEAILQEK